MAEHRHALMDAEQWQLHERTLRMFPAETVAADPDLLLMAAWMARLGGFDATPALDLVDRAESLVAQMADQPEHAVHLRGEIDTLRTAVAYEAATDPENVIALARRALATTPRAWYYVRSTAWLYLALAYQMAGRLDQAYAVLAEGQARGCGCRMALCAHGWRPHAASSSGWRAICRRCRRGRPVAVAVGETHHRHESLGWAHYLLSSVAYQRNDLPAAEAHARAVEEIRYLGRPMAYLQSAFIYASIYQARGLPDQARQKLELAFDLPEGDPQRRAPPAGASVPGGAGRAARRSRRGQPVGDDDRTLCAAHGDAVLLRAATDAAEDPPGAGHACQPRTGRRGAIPAARVRHSHPQHALHHRGAGVGGPALPRAGERARRAAQPWNKP